MESKPRRIPVPESSTDDQETQDIADIHDPDASEELPLVRPAAKAGSQFHKTPTPVEPSEDADLTPVMSSPPLSILMPGMRPGKNVEPTESLLEIALAAVPVTRAAAIGKPTEVSSRNPLIGVLRILAVRNIEIARRYSGRASQSSRQFVHSVSIRVSSVQIGGKSIGEIGRETGRRLRSAPGNLLTQLQRTLEVSDAAVVVLTLFLIAACVLLTLFGVYLVNRF